MLAESRRITTGDNVSLQKVAQARETEMRDWQALNRRLNEVRERESEREREREKRARKKERENEMRDWQALNRRLNEVRVCVCICVCKYVSNMICSLVIYLYGTLYYILL